MNINGPTTPNIPFHVARAYNLPPNAQARRSAGVEQNQGVETQARVAAGSGGAGKLQANALPDNAQRLVAALVPGRVDFSGERPAPVGGALPMYAHPADKNAAATAVNVGRSLDVRG